MTVLLATFLGIAARAAEPTLTDSDLPRIPATEPARALATIKVRPGFHIELAAAEPDVASPVALAFDENGRLFVVEMRDYSERRDEHLGRVRMLEDTDGDGRYDKSTVYADNLPWPTAVVCYDGGVFIGATPDILYCKDTDGDGRADTREVAFTGFASDYAPYQVSRLTVQALMNSFQWGLDNRIHGSASLSGGKITSPAHPEMTPVDLRGRDFSFDPRTLSLRPESGGGQHGMSFDNTGRKFVCSNSDHIQLEMYEDRYAARNPFFAMAGPRSSIAMDGPAAEVYRLSPDEPWRVIRTKWRVTGVVQGMIEGGGRPSGYFTGATGVTIFRGDAFPADYQGDAFVADCGSNLIHHKKLRPDGVGLRAERAADEQKSEFAASTDNWFRPVQFANAPDGTLYFADMYREVIEHPWSLPAAIKQHLDLNSGNNRGRIYRITPNGFQRPALPKLGEATTRQLVATLASPNGWHRDTAARLLYERRDASSIPLLEKMIRREASPLGRMHALYALSSLQGLQVEDLVRGMDDPSPAVRRHAVRLAEPLIGVEDISAPLWRRLRRLTDDPDPLTRYQLAFSLGYARYHGQPRLLAALARRDAGDARVREAILSSAANTGAELFNKLADDDKFAKTSGGRSLLMPLAQMIGARNRRPEVDSALGDIRGAGSVETKLALAAALGEGLQRAGSSLAQATDRDRLRPVLAMALHEADNAKAGESLRVAALQFLGQTAYTDSREVILRQLAPGLAQPVQLAAVAALGHQVHPAIGAEVIKRWDTLTPKVRAAALSMLLARAERIPALLDAVEKGTVPKADLPTSQIVFLRSHRDSAIQERAMKIFAAGQDQRVDVIQKYVPSLSMEGDAGRGRGLFSERCATCHKLNGVGTAVGPDLASARSNGKEKLLISILDPNREIAPNFLNYTVETKDGETLTGLIANDSAAGITLRRANGEESVVARDRISRIQTQNLSLMPEGLEAGLTNQEMANLLEFLEKVE
ncbi:MAG TPA: PVC-type heme-binding CxxCH protein [Verrucomicrobiae bacterium]|nr:PVC-type heme-binding CxxCH protein [Verrucomicrobiae bacterium]